MVVLGDGAVGVGIAQAYNALGSTVTLIEADRLLTREEPFAGEQLHEALVERGVDVCVGVEAQAVRRGGASVTVNLSDGGQVEADEILVAVGRSPRTDDIGLETVGLQPGKPVTVDDRLHALGLAWLFAIGDLNERSPRANWLHAATIVLVAEIPVARLGEAAPAFPTRSEIWLDLLEKRETSPPADTAGGHKSKWPDERRGLIPPGQPWASAGTSVSGCPCQHGVGVGFADSSVSQRSSTIPTFACTYTRVLPERARNVAARKSAAVAVGFGDQHEMPAGVVRSGVRTPEEHDHNANPVRE